MKKRIMIIAMIVLILVGAGVLYYFTKNTSNNSNSEEIKTCEQIADTFYQDYYYDLVTIGKTTEEKAELLSNYNENGIKIAISEIQKISEIDISEYIEKIETSVNLEETIIKIYPKESYGKTDYTIKVEIVEK